MPRKDAEAAEKEKTVSRRLFGVRHPCAALYYWCRGRVDARRRTAMRSGPVNSIPLIIPIISQAPQG